jgi:transcriptional regulator with XRE-family HTH domain
MTVSNVGTYIRVLMEGRSLTALTVTQAAGVHPNYVWRLEKGRIKKPALEAIVKLVRTVGGSLDDIDFLMGAPSSAYDATERAERILKGLAPDIQDRIRQLEATKEGRQALIDAARRYLATSP